MSKPEWYYILLGTLGAGLTGSFPIAIALLVGELFGVSVYKQYLVVISLRMLVIISLHDEMTKKNVISGRIPNICALGKNNMISSLVFF